MDKRNIWEVLGIHETRDQKLIKEAYRKQLIHTNPEDDEQGFIILRNAYEEAVRLSTEPDSRIEEEEEKDDIDLWISRAEDIYMDIHKRRNIALWEEILDDPVCQGLDTWLKAREKLLVYLMSHFYLPHDAWVLFDRKFDLVKDQDNLIQSFPKDFIEYVIHQVQNYPVFDLDLLITDGEGMADDYIHSYYDIKRMLDQGKSEELWEEFRKADNMGMYHPCMDAEKVRYFMAMDKKEEMNNLIHKLSSYLKNDYIAYFVGEAHWFAEQYDEAAIIWEGLCEKYPNHYGAWIGMIKYYIHKGKYQEANKHAIDLLETHKGDTEIKSLLNKANESLIKEYEKTCEAEPDNIEVKKELAWCYYQNSYMDQCLRLLKEFQKETKNESWYLRIHGFVYGKRSEFKKALEYLLKWAELLKTSQEDEDYRERFCQCHYTVGICYIGEKDYKNAIPYLKDAITFEEDKEEKLSSMERLAYSYLKLGRNEDCIDECDEIILLSEDYYPAYLHRQEAYFNMKNGQGVVDDYYKAIEIYSGYVKPYLLAAKVFFFYQQYEDSLGVINRAKEANLNSHELELFYAKNKHCLAQSQEEGEVVLKILLDLTDKLRNSTEVDVSDNEDEICDLGEVFYETARVYAYIKRYQEALGTIEKAILQNPSSAAYYSMKANICMNLSMSQKAISIWERLVKEYPKWVYAHISLAKCYQGTDRTKEALSLYKKALDIDPEDTEALKEIGDIYIDFYQNKNDMKYFELARQYGEKLIAIEPSSANYIHMGIIYRNGYELEKALECYKKASECDPDNMWPYNNAGYVLKIMKRYEDAIGEYKKAIERMEPGQSKTPFNNLADCYKILERYEEAMDCYKELLKLWPDEQDIFKDMADIFECMGKPEEAEKIYLDMIKNYNYPKDEAYCEIMDIYRATDISKAAQYARKAVTANKKSTVILRKVGWFYFSIGKFNLAKDSFKKAIKNFDDQKSERYALCCEYLAQVYFDEGKTKKAEQMASEALSVIRSVYGDERTFVSYKPYLPSYNSRMGMIYMMLGNFEKAENYFMEAITNLPCISCHLKGCDEGYYSLGRLYEERKEFHRAEECYKKAIELSIDGDFLYKRHLLQVEKKNV